MKPIYLSPDDEITSLIEKIGAVSDVKLALVAPKNSSIFQSLINLKLLKKEATVLGKEVVIITASKVGQKLSEQVGIKSYATVTGLGIKESVQNSEPASVSPAEILPDGTRIHQYNPDKKAEDVTPETNEDEKEDVPEETVEAEEKAEEVGEQKIELPKIPVREPVKEDELPAITGLDFKQHREFYMPWKSLVGAFIVLLIAFIALYIFLPKAYISATFASKKVSAKISMSIITEGIVGEENIEGVKLSVTKSGTQTFKASGQKDVGTKATGSVTITNKYKDGSGVGKNQTFASGTKLTDSKSGKVFLLDSAVTVGKVTYDPNNGQPIYQSKTAGVTALEPGEAYNIAASSFTISGALADVTAVSSTAFKGGLTKKVTVISKQDIDAALKTLKEKVNGDALSELKTKAEGKKLIESAVLYTTVKESTDKKADDQASEATAIYEVAATVVVFDAAALEQKVKTALSKDIKENQQLVLSENTLDKAVITNAAVAKLSLDAEGNISVKTDNSEIINAVKNKSANQVSAILKDQFSASEVVVDISPSWWFQRTPMFSWAIKFDTVLKSE